MIGGDDTSPDHKLLAWTEDTVGGEKYTLHVKVRMLLHHQQGRVNLAPQIDMIWQSALEAANAHQLGGWAHFVVIGS